jgi:hypothetical protein
VAAAKETLKKTSWYPLMAMLRVHLMQNWSGYSDPAMEEALRRGR